MRVVYADETKIPSLTANSIHVMKMCQAMAQRGHDVDLFVPRWHIESGLHSVDLWHHYGIRTRFNIHWLPRLEKLGGQLFALLCVINAWRLHADVLYTRTLAVAGLAAFIGLPVVCEFHAIPEGITTSFYVKLLNSGKGLRGLVVITRGLYDDLLSFSPVLFRAKPVIIAPDGVDLERFIASADPKVTRVRVGLKADDYIAGYAGHFYPGKGIEIIMELAPLCPTIKFLIMGGAPDAVASLKAQCVQHGIKNMIFCGFIPNTKLPDYLSACDVLLLPNQSRVSGTGGSNIAHWTSPMKLFEYMAAGRLIIASDLPVLREVLNETNACFCRPEDAEDWRRVLVNSRTNTDLRENKARKARSDVEQFDWKRRVDKCFALFSGIAEN